MADLITKGVSNPFINRKVQRVDGISKDSTESGTEPRNAVSAAPSFKNYRKLLDCVYLYNPILALLLEMQSLTGLRFSDASTLIRSDFYDKETDRFKPYFDFTPLKAYNLAYTKIAKSQKGKNLSHSKIDSLAKSDAMITVFTNDRIKEVISEVNELNSHIDSPFLFASDHRFSGGNPVSIQYANRLLKRLHKLYPTLGFNETGTHSFRKYFATSMVELNGAHVVQVQALLGHKDINTTIKYISKTKADLQQLIKEMKLESA